jgi:hypothetical protein
MAFTIEGSKVVQLIQFQAYIDFILSPARCMGNLILVAKRIKLSLRLISQALSHDDVLGIEVRLQHS